MDTKSNKAFGIKRVWNHSVTGKMKKHNFDQIQTTLSPKIFHGLAEKYYAIHFRNGQQLAPREVTSRKIRYEFAVFASGQHPVAGKILAKSTYYELSEVGKEYVISISKQESIIYFRNG